MILEKDQYEDLMKVKDENKKLKEENRKIKSGEIEIVNPGKKSSFFKKLNPNLIIIIFGFLLSLLIFSINYVNKKFEQNQPRYSLQSMSNSDRLTKVEECTASIEKNINDIKINLRDNVQDIKSDLKELRALVINKNKG
jgi:hypothetical protein